jgi:hypothetical protein
MCTVKKNSQEAEQLKTGIPGLFQQLKKTPNLDRILIDRFTITLRATASQVLVLPAINIGMRSYWVWGGTILCCKAAR